MVPDKRNGFSSVNFHELNGGHPTVLSGKHNDVTSVRYYELNGGKPISIDYYAKPKQERITKMYIHADPGPSFQGDNVEQTIDYPTCVIESNDVASSRSDTPTIVTELNNPPPEPINAIIIEEPKPVVRSEITTQTVSVDSQATQTFQAATQSTQTIQVEAQATQTMVDTKPEIVIVPPTPAPIPKPEVKEVETQYNVTYPPEVEEEEDPYPVVYPPEDWLQWESYYYNSMAPYMYPPMFYDDDNYLSDEPKKRKKKKPKTKQSKTIETQTIIPKEERKEKEKEVTKVIERQVIIVPDSRYASENTQTKEHKEVTENKSEAVEVYKENKYKDYFGNFSNNHMSVMQFSDEKRKSVPNGVRKNQGNRSKSSKGFKKGNVLISEKDLIRIWNSRNQHKKHVGDNGSIKLELPPDYLNRARFDDVDNAKNEAHRNSNSDQTYSRSDNRTIENRTHRSSYTNLLRGSEMAQNIPPADYDTGYRRTDLESNQSSVLQRYLQDIEDNTEHFRNVNSQGNDYALRRSERARQYGKSHESGYISHVGSYRPEADTIMHRNEALTPHFVEILPEDTP